MPYKVSVPSNCSGSCHHLVLQSFELQGLDLEAADHKGRTALHYAAMQGDVALLQMLLEAGANVNAQDSFASAPLYSAVRLKFAAASQLLLAWKVSLESAH